jgi:hypothetical protein
VVENSAVIRQEALALVRTKILIKTIVSRILITVSTPIAKDLLNTKRDQDITKEVMESVDNREHKNLYLLSFSVIQIIPNISIDGDTVVIPVWQPLVKCEESP